MKGLYNMWIDYDKEKPAANGVYVCKVNDMVNDWFERLNYHDGAWFSMHGDAYTCIVDWWYKKEISTP